MTPEEVKSKIEILESKFEDIKMSAIQLLDDNNVGVKYVVHKLTELPASEVSQHKMFLDKKLYELMKCLEHIALFSALNLYWNFLSPHLLAHIIKKLPALHSLKEEMHLYMKELYQFKTQTPLEIFCQINEEYVEIPEELCTVVATFKRKVKVNTTLQEVDIFRSKYARHYKLRDFALMFKSAKKGSFIVTFLVPESILEILMHDIPGEILKECDIMTLEIGGQCIYKSNAEQSEPSALHSNSISNTEAPTPTVTVSPDSPSVFRVVSAVQHPSGTTLDRHHVRTESHSLGMYVN